MTADPFASVRGRKPRPWPLQPLLDVIDPKDELSRWQAAKALNVAEATFYDAVKVGLTDKQADHWATRIGSHPALIWGWAWFEAAPPAKDCARTGCPELVDPARTYCSNRCAAIDLRGSKEAAA